MLLCLVAPVLDGQCDTLYRYRCPIDGCSATCETERTLRLHASHAHKDPNIYICPVATCSFACNDKRKRRLHRRTHAERKWRCTHQNCGRAYGMQSELRRHKLCAHPAETAHYTCAHDGCNFVTRSRYLLNHMKTHRGELFLCPYHGCSHTSKSGEAMKRHERAVHARYKFVCRFHGCAHSMKTPYALRSHYKVRHNYHHVVQVSIVQAFRCGFPKCSFATSARFKLLLHLGKHYNANCNVYQCYFGRCEFRAPLAFDLNSHVNAVHKSFC